MNRVICAALLLLSTTASADNRWRPPRWHQRPPASMERLQQLTRACEDAMEGPDNERACLDTVSRSRRDDLPAVIRACEDAMEGDPNELSCIATMANSWLVAPAVRACEDAMEGDPNELRCLSSLIGSRYEPTELVRYCEDKETGDDAELSCIARWR